MNITPLDADQFTRVVRCFTTVQFFVQCRATNKKRLLDKIQPSSVPFYSSNSSPTLLSSFLSLRRLPLTQSAHYVSKQLKVESELKFSYPGNERNYKFNLEVLDHLENVSKALLVQDSAKASLLLNDSIKLIKERNRKIRIADSSEGGDRKSVV